MGRTRAYLLGLVLALALAACGGGKPVAEKPVVPSEGSTAQAAERDRNARAMRLFLEATQARLAGQPGQAALLYEQGLKEDPRNAAAMFELGKLYHQQRNTRLALDYAKRAVATDKENIWYRFLLADLYRESGPAYLEQTAEVYRGIVTKWPDRYEVYFDLAGTLAQAGKVNEALKVYGDMEKRFGPTQDILMQQFGLLAANNRLEEAEKLVRRAIAAHPTEATYRALLAELYDQRGEHDKAQSEYRAALDLDPGNSMVRMALAEHYYNAGRSDEAFEELRLVFQDPDLDIDAKMQMLIGFFEMSNHEGTKPGDRPELIERSYMLIDVLKSTHPESGKPSTIRGDFLLRDGRLEEAREEFRLALKHEPERYPIWAQLLNLDLQLGDHAGLVKDAEDAIGRFPLIPELHLYKGIGLSQLGRHQEAIDALLEGRDLVVDNPALLAQFWTSLGDAYHEAKDHPRSDEAYEKALAIQPNEPNTLNNFAYYLSLRREKLDQAERMSRRSNELAPGQPSYLDTYAWVLFVKGDYSNARTWIEKALAAGGKDQGVIVEHYGDILYKLNDRDGALEQWKKARELGGASELLERKINEGTWVE